MRWIAVGEQTNPRSVLNAARSTRDTARRPRPEARPLDRNLNGDVEHSLELAEVVLGHAQKLSLVALLGVDDSQNLVVVGEVKVLVGDYFSAILRKAKSL